MAILGYKNSTQFIRALGLEEWLKTRGLAGWLEVATDDLEAPARQRIADEIGAHYAEAVSSHRAAGEPEYSAEAMALAELGDPQQAAQNFQKSHLTESDAKRMQWMERTAAKPLFSFRMLLLDIIMPFAGLFLLLYFHVNWFSDFQSFALFLLIPYLGYRLIPRLLYTKALRRTSFLKGLALSSLITGMAFWFTFARMRYMHDHAAFSAILNCCLYGYLCNFRDFRIWNKLRKMGDGRNDLPPQQTPAF